MGPTRATAPTQRPRRAPRPGARLHAAAALLCTLLLGLGCASTPEPAPPPPPPPPPVEPAPPPPPPDPTTFTATVAFEPGSAVLSPAGIAEIDAFAAKLRDFPERRVHVVGHSEDHGADAGNPWLSEQRARAVASLLTAEGIAIEHVSLEGVGSDGGGGRTARVSVR